MHVYVKKVVAGLAAAALMLLPAAAAFADGGHSQTATPIKHHQASSPTPTGPSFSQMPSPADPR